MSARVAAFLRERHPDHTAKTVEGKTRIPWRTVERWLCESATPSLPHFLSLLEAYGPALLDAMAPGAFDWLDQAKRVEGCDQVEARLNEIVATIETLQGRK